MQSPDYRDLVGGVALIAVGLAVTANSVLFLSLGTASSMGPGAFPAGLGVVLAVLGAMIALPALFQSGEFPSIEVRPLLAVLGAILIFALVMESFGLVPAVTALTFIAGLADRRLSLLGTAALAAALSTIATLIFRTGLGLPIPIVSWPW
jgi:hypothetical protein